MARFRATASTPEERNKEQSSHENFIQIWRGIAVFLVVYYHFSNRIPTEYLNMTSEPSLVFHAGKIGVLIFFVISGYLISKSLMRCDNLAIFYAKRISRIWPLFIIASVVIFLYLQFVEPPIVYDGPKKFYTEKRDWLDLLGSILFLEDIGFRWIDGVFWSLLVELKFYFWIGLLAYFRGQKFGRDFALCALMLGGIVLGIELSGYESFAWIAKGLNGLFIAQYLPFFAVGVLLATGRDKGFLSILLIIITVQSGLKSGANPDFDIHQSAIFILVVSAVLLLDQLFFRSKIFLHLGRYSYSYYLFHQIIGLSIIKALGGFVSFDLAILIALIATYAIAVIAADMAEWRFRPVFSKNLLALFSRLRLNRMPLFPVVLGTSIAK